MTEDHVLEKKWAHALGNGNYQTFNKAILQALFFNKSVLN